MTAAGARRLAPAVLTFASIPGIVILSALRSHRVDLVVAGQYLYPALLPLLAALTWGLWQACRTPGQRRWLLGGAVALLLGANLSSLFQGLVPRHAVSVEAYLQGWQAGIIALWALAATALAWQLISYWVAVPAGELADPDPG